MLERGISKPASKQFQCLGNFRCRRWQDGDAISTEIWLAMKPKTFAADENLSPIGQLARLNSPPGRRSRADRIARFECSLWFARNFNPEIEKFGQEQRETTAMI